VQGPGEVSLQFEDANGHNRKATGPKVDAGDEGSLLVTVGPAGAVTFNASVTQPR
jgi:hypothetical protein